MSGKYTVCLVRNSDSEYIQVLHAKLFLNIPPILLRLNCDKHKILHDKIGLDLHKSTNSVCGPGKPLHGTIRLYICHGHIIAQCLCSCPSLGNLHLPSSLVRSTHICVFVSVFVISIFICVSVICVCICIYRCIYICDTRGCF